MVHWEHLPIALSPGKGTYDKDGCWSGCAVDNNSVPTIIYTGIMPEVQCIAFGDQELVSWEKYLNNPVIKLPPHDYTVTGFRDPCVWKENDTWYMILGSGIKGVGGAVLLYESKDLLRWRYMHPLFIGEKEKTGEVWECPDLFPLGNKHILLISTLRRNLYFVGNYIDHKFYPDKQGMLDMGNLYQAARSMVDSSGRRIVVGWIREARSSPMQIASGWSGAFSLPRTISLDKCENLIMKPLPELKSLRSEPKRYENIQIKTDTSIQLEDVRGDSLEIVADFCPVQAEEFGIKIRSSPNLEEQTLITYKQKKNMLEINNSNSSLSLEADRGTQGGILGLGKNKRLKLHVFLDKSIVEVFANDQICLTNRIYPTRGDSVKVSIFSKKGIAKLLSLDSWEIKSIWL